MIRVLVIGLLFSYTCMVSGQIEIGTGFSKDTVQVGEEVSYKIAVQFDKQANIVGVDLTQMDSIISVMLTQIEAQSDTTGAPADVIGDYNITSYGNWSDDNEDKKISGSELRWDTVGVGNLIRLENTFKISFWDFGNNVIKVPDIEYSIGGMSSTIKTDKYARVFVAPPFQEKELSDSMDIAPIRTIIEEERNITDFYIYFYILGAILLLPILYLLYKKLTHKETVTREEIITITPAHEIALQKLDALRESKLWQKNEVKEYQTQLTYTIREYLENRYEIQALESSTDEIVKALRDSKFESKDETDLKTILQVADLVKFAKANPSAEIHEEFLNTAFSFVEKTKSNEPPKTETRIVHKEENIQAAKATQAKVQSASTQAEIPSEKVKPRGTEKLIPKAYKFAGFWRRYFAYAIDINLSFVIFFLFYFLIFKIVRLEDGDSDMILKVILFSISFLIIYTLYFAYAQHKYRKTLGKRILGIEVVTKDFDNISFGQGLARIFFKILQLPIFNILFVTFFFSKKKQTLHDMIAKTIVIRKDKVNLQQDLLDVEL